jgi:CheY-like chemotaxis protein
MVKAASGGLEVHSTPGSGATFQLWFPRVVPIEETLPTVQHATPGRGSETILLVDDEQDLLEATQEILALLGYQVFAAGDADQARAFLQGYKGELHLLVTDVIMPGDSGPVLAAEVLRARPGVRVLYISGYTADELKSHGLTNPGVAILEKPYTMEQIGQSVWELLQSPFPPQGIKPPSSNPHTVNPAKPSD